MVSAWCAVIFPSFFSLNLQLLEAVPARTDDPERENPMKPAAQLVGLTAACAACCALPVAFSLVTALGLGSLLDGRFGLAAVAATLATIGLVMARRRAPRRDPMSKWCRPSRYHR